MGIGRALPLIVAELEALQYKLPTSKKSWREAFFPDEQYLQ